MQCSHFPSLSHNSSLAGGLALLRTTLILIVVLATGCSSSIYGWHVRTNSSPPSPTFNRAVLLQEPVAIFGALAPPALLGSETGLDSILVQVLKKVAPSFKVITPQETASLINRNDLAAEYTRMRTEALQSHVLDRGVLKKVGTAIGVRYVFQPKLTAFMQITKDRWELPPIALKVSRIRSSIMRLSLQLWDMQTGDVALDFPGRGKPRERSRWPGPSLFRGYSTSDHGKCHRRLHEWQDGLILRPPR